MTEEENRMALLDIAHQYTFKDFESHREFEFYEECLHMEYVASMNTLVVRAFSNNEMIKPEDVLEVMESAVNDAYERIIKMRMDKKIKRKISG